MIGHLCDHVARIWTLTEEPDSMMSRRRVYEVLPINAAVHCAINRKNTAIGQMPPGRTPVGDRMFYCDIGPEFGEMSVIEVFEGPDAPSRIEVQSVTRPRGHHVEARGSEFRGKLPGDEGGS